MARETLNIENRDGGRYFVEVQATVPDVRRREKLVTGDVFAAINQLIAFCRELGLGEQSNKPLPRPALQADIDRAQAAQEAAEDDPLMPLDMVVKRPPGRPRKEA